MSVAFSILFSVVGYLIGIALIPRIIMQRRQSGATLAWVLVIIFLPYIGAFLFLAIGAQTIRWRRKRRQRTRERRTNE